MSEIKPIDVKIYYTDGQPYLDYIGTVETDYGKLKIHIPKLGLSFSSINEEFESAFRGKIKLCGFRRDIYVVDDKCYEMQILERNMSRKEIENELGYKVNIKD